MKKIRVVQIVPALSPGGAERVAVHVATGIDRRRYEPVVISLMGRMDCYLERLLEEAGVEARYLGKHFGFDHRMYPRVYRALKDCRADIVHTHLQVLRYVFPCLMLLKQDSVLHTVHNLAEREIEPGMRWLQRCALKNGVVPVAVAEEVAASLQDLYRIPKSRVITNGIPTDTYTHPQTPRNEWRARQNFGDDDVLFVCVAGFRPQKNHALLLKAFAQGPACDPKAHLVLVGEGDLREQLEKLAKQHDLTRQVHFLGLRTDIPEVLGAMDVFVLSSDWEGNPLSVMEAMAAGLPIVSTAVGGVPDMFEDGKEGVLVPPGDVQALSSSLSNLLRDREARKSLGSAAGRKAKGKYDVSAMIQAYEEMYEQILEQRHPLKAEGRLRESAVRVQEAAGSQSH